ncbi:hypothetical protein L198_04192 [Cryptococcus wingfieldii CBS 7118]|uniref:Uncharacterized protein n=1 Tax=Cryptococcus wingfieldii CBS 7118 TaxID=1295528 RepID=A0A1E3J6J7_9TREE|nr:hypothetical protein L198_04192 [Cryptococcus wingfieldii CBS 7118]ODN96478.1 hypothetical protein L198_04192 [Cryptococcus wingfieldii CBS 7118]
MAETSSYLTWTNVLIGLLFIIFDSVLSLFLGLGISSSLLVAALRCIVQLTIMSTVLGKVFASNNVWGVFGIAVLLNLMAATEATYNKSKRRFTNMFPLILAAMLCGTIPVSVLGTQYAMAQHPFWQPDQYIPIIGMILGNAISSLGIALNTTHKEFSENKDKVESFLALGASRFEACKPIAVSALKLALLPTVNQLSVIGLISIPGMMTGAIVGGKSVEQAARLQMIIMFMISASSALCTLIALFFSLSTLVDGCVRIRSDRLTSEAPLLYRWRNEAGAKMWKVVARVGGAVTGKKRESGTEEERRGLLDGQQG